MDFMLRTDPNVIPPEMVIVHKTRGSIVGYIIEETKHRLKVIFVDTLIGNDFKTVKAGQTIKFNKEEIQSAYQHVYN